MFTEYVLERGYTYLPENTAWRVYNRGILVSDWHQNDSYCGFSSDNLHL
jgi:hypothetical protein